MEKDITISGRAEDAKLINTAAEEAAKEFEEKAGFEIKWKVDEGLPKKS